MAALSALIASAAVVSAGASLATGYQQSQVAKAEATAAKGTAEVNTLLSNVAAEDAIARGEKDAAAIKRNARRLTGAQRAAMAAQGLDPDAGSGLDLQLDTAALSAADALTTRNNAWREAWGYRVQAVDATAKGQFAEIAGNAKSRASILTGGLDAAAYGLKGGYGYLSETQRAQDRAAGK